jgi:hypothetical protein
LDHAKSPFDSLIDILLWIPNCLALRSQINTVKDNDPLTYKALLQKLRNRLQNPLSRLDQWRLLYGKDVLGEHDCGGLSKSDTAYSGSMPETKAFLDPHTATVIAYYDVANILTQHLLQIATGNLTEHIIKQHAASALSAAKYHQSIGVSSSGTFVFVFVLKTICLLTPCNEQKREAQDAILTWGIARGLEGVCSSGAPLTSEQCG